MFISDYFQAVSEGWIICVPRRSSVRDATLSDDVVTRHILVPDDEVPETHFRYASLGTISGGRLHVRFCVRLAADQNMESDVLLHF
jgi:hypothetical protein